MNSRACLLGRFVHKILFLTVLALGHVNGSQAQGPSPLPVVSGVPAGSIEGQFDVNDNGAATYSMKLAVPPGTNGMSPELSLTYSSDGDDGYLGRGWALSGISAITRCQTTMGAEGFVNPVDFDLYDKFCLDGQRLVAISGGYTTAGSVYRTTNESFTKITANGSLGSYWQNGPASFTAITKSGLTIEYGSSDDSRLQATGADGVLGWFAKRVTDRNGNYFEISYQKSLSYGEVVPQRIDYTGNQGAGLSPYNSVRFLYDPLPTPMAKSVAGESYSLLSRLRTIQMYTDSTLAWEYRLSYSTDLFTRSERLTSIQECDAQNSCLPATTFEWGSGPSLPGYFSSPTLLNALGVNQGFADNLNFPTLTGDWNGDGRTDIARTFQQANTTSVTHFYISTATGFQSYGTTTTTFQEAPSNYEYEYTSIVGDWNGDGRTDFARARLGNPGPGFNTNVIFFYVSTGSGFTHQTTTPASTFPMCSGEFSTIPGVGKLLVGDWDGDGRSDIARVYKPNCTQFATWDASSSSLNPRGAMLPSIATQTCTHEQCPVLVGDWNGDGVSDIARVVLDRVIFYVASSWNFQPFHAFYELTTHYGFSLAQGYSDIDTHPILIGDFNGDRVTDFGRIGANGIRLCRSFAQPYIHAAPDLMSACVTSPFPTVPGYYNNSNYPVVLGDWNGDGTTDIARTHPDGVLIYHVTELVPEQAPFVHQLSNTQGFLSHVQHPLFSGDWNGDGLTDLARGGAAGIHVALHDASESTVIRAITNGFGARTEITYGHLTDPAVYTKGTSGSFPDIDISDSSRVTKQVTASDGTSTTSTLLYHYTGKRFDQLNRTPLGFAEIATTNVPTGNVKRVFFRRDNLGFDGLPFKTETRTANGTLIHKSEDTWTTLGVAPYQAYQYISRNSEYIYELNGLITRSVQTDTSVDAWGNTTNILVTRSDGSTENTVYTFNNDSANWIIGQVLTATVTRTGATAAPVPALTRRATFTYAPGTGRLLSEVTEPGGAFTLAKTYTHDSFGNVTATSVAGATVASRTSTKTYDARGRFAINETNALGHTDTRTFDSKHGAITSHTDPNGITKTWEYDSFGRVRLETRADGTVQRTLTLVAPASSIGNASYLTRVDASGLAPLITYFDALSREIRRETVGFNGQLIFVDKIYDDAGNLTHESEPYFENQPVQWNINEYDPVGRLTRVTAPGNRVTTFQYNAADWTFTTNPLGQMSSTRVDSQGRMVESVDADGKHTTYRYDAFGSPIQVTDSLGNTTSTQYNVRGQKTQVSEPNSGTTVFQYSLLGELLQQTNANNEVVTYSYDLLGRATQRTSPEGQESWVYDTAPYGIGKLHRTIGLNNYTATLIYDSFGREVSLVKAIGGRNFAVSQTYNPNGLVATTTFPSGFSIRNIYNSLGHLSEIRRVDTNVALWTPLQRNARAQLERVRLGNGLVTTNAYSATDGLIQSIQTGIGASIQNLSFQFDSIGNLTQRSDARISATENFTYDNLNRLTSSQVVGQPAVSVSYDEIGNIISRSDVGTYQYGGTQAGPHAVVNIVGPRGNNYSYDNSGNRISSSDGSIQYTSSGKPHTISKGASQLRFEHNPEGTRTVQRVYSGTTLTETKIYVNPQYEETTTQGLVRQLHYIYADGEPVALFTGSPLYKSAAVVRKKDINTVRYFHRDHLGSIQSITNEAGSLVEVLSFNSWGERRNASTWGPVTTVYSSTDRGFTGHEQLDEVTLIHMNGRVYDPVIGRFISPDPFVQNPRNQQGLNRYSYVQNNPLSFVDPSGYFLKGFLKKVGKFLKKAAPIIVSVVVFAATNGWATPLLQTTWLSCVTGGGTAISAISGAASGFAASVASSLVSGAGLSASLRTGFRSLPTSGLRAALAFEIGQFLRFEGDQLFGENKFIARGFAHALSNGATNVLQGGKFGSGFASGLAAGLTEGNGFELTVLAAGTASAISGGKFSDGVMQGAFVYTFNCMMTPGCARWMQDQVGAEMARRSPEAQEAAAAQRAQEALRVQTLRRESLEWGSLGLSVVSNSLSIASIICPPCLALSAYTGAASFALGNPGTMMQGDVYGAAQFTVTSGAQQALTARGLGPVGGVVGLYGDVITGVRLTHKAQHGD